MYLTHTAIKSLSDSALLANLESIQTALINAAEPNPLYMTSRDWQVAECVRRGLVGR